MDWLSSYNLPKKKSTGKVAKKLGVNLNPPAIVLIYEDSSLTGTVKRKKRIIPVQHLFDFKFNLKLMVQDIQTDFLTDIEGSYDTQLEKMLRIIQESKKGLPLSEALVVVNKEYEIEADEDLNKLSTPLLERKKAIMQTSYLKNYIRPGDPGYVYDKQVDFDDLDKQPADWDDDGSDIDNRVFDLKL